MLTKVSCDAQRPRPLGPGRLPPCGRLLMTRWTGGKSAAVRRAETCAACPPSSSSPTDTREGSSTKDFPGGSDGKASAYRAGDLGREDPLEEEMAPHSSTLAWKIPWTEEPGGLQSVRSQRVGQGRVTSPYLTLLRDRDRVSLLPLPSGPSVTY